MTYLGRCSMELKATTHLTMKTRQLLQRAQKNSNVCLRFFKPPHFRVVHQYDCSIAHHGCSNRGQCIRHIQQLAHVEITPIERYKGFQLKGHPMNVKLVRNFLDTIILRKQTLSGPYIIVMVAGPSIRADLSSLSKLVTNAAEVTAEDELHFTVLQMQYVTHYEMRDICNRIQAVLPMIRALASPTPITQFAFLNADSSRCKISKRKYIIPRLMRYWLGIMGLAPDPQSNLHMIRDIILDAVDMRRPCRRKPKLHISLLKRPKGRIEAPHWLLDACIATLTPDRILGPVRPVSIHISQFRYEDCIGDRRHVLYRTIPIE
ncbi:hypothetical protein BX666DRAFT_1948594 [Dichotomocladium elegans]|nr:hypothetical protein BX666DRAFT_1948594 [Dichotomocladium elegans]